jgi:hypothetical protein
VERENIPAAAVGRGIANVHFLKSSAVGWQLNKLSIVLNAQVFHAKNWKDLIDAIGPNME